MSELRARGCIGVPDRGTSRWGGPWAWKECDCKDQSSWSQWTSSRVKEAKIPYTQGRLGVGVVWAMRSWRSWAKVRCWSVDLLESSLRLSVLGSEGKEARLDVGRPVRRWSLCSRKKRMDLGLWSWQWRWSASRDTVEEYKILLIINLSHQSEYHLPPRPAPCA